MLKETRQESDHLREENTRLLQQTVDQDVINEHQQCKRTFDELMLDLEDQRKREQQQIDARLKMEEELLSWKKARQETEEQLSKVRTLLLQEQTRSATLSKEVQNLQDDTDYDAGISHIYTNWKRRDLIKAIIENIDERRQIESKMEGLTKSYGEILAQRNKALKDQKELNQYLIKLQSERDHFATKATKYKETAKEEESLKEDEQEKNSHLEAQIYDLNAEIRSLTDKKTQLEQNIKEKEDVLNTPGINQRYQEMYLELKAEKDKAVENLTQVKTKIKTEQTKVSKLKKTVEDLITEKNHLIEERRKDQKVMREQQIQLHRRIPPPDTSPAMTRAKTNEKLRIVATTQISTDKTANPLTLLQRLSNQAKDDVKFRREPSKIAQKPPFPTLDDEEMESNFEGSQITEDSLLESSKATDVLDSLLQAGETLDIAPAEIVPNFGYQQTGIQITKRDIPRYDGIAHDKGNYASSKQMVG